MIKHCIYRGGQGKEEEPVPPSTSEKSGFKETKVLAGHFQVGGGGVIGSLGSIGIPCYVTIWQIHARVHTQASNIPPGIEKHPAPA